MDADTYPGKGLSLPQLVFALSEELRTTNHLWFLTPDTVSQLEQDISTALRIVREVKNTSAPINRIPLDILSLIPTHLPLQKDRFLATFVCRHWRRVFLQHAALWSQLFTKKGEEYVTTLLKRAKGAKLDIVINHSDFHMFANNPPSTMALLSPHTRRISSLTLSLNRWMDVLAFSEVTSAPLPFLRTLEIRLAHHDDRFNRLTAQMLPLFSGAVNLEEFSFQPKRSASLNHFAFPTLTTLKLLILPMNRWIAQELFDFLKASPTLLTVKIRVEEGGIPENIPREMVVVLPNVETLSLNVDGNGLQAYELAVHISCPRAKYTSLTQDIGESKMSSNLKSFPDPVSWEAISSQYTTSPVEEVTFETYDDQLPTIFAYSLTFKSSDATAVRLGFRVTESGTEEEDLEWSHLHEAMNCETFSRACRAIRDHPQLSHLKRLHLKDRFEFFGIFGDYTEEMANMLWELFRWVGPLDELVIHAWDPEMFVPGIENVDRVLPAVRELRISDIRMVDEERCADGIVELARSQHELEKPFERVTVSGWGVPAVMAGELRRWVNEVDCYELP